MAPHLRRLIAALTCIAFMSVAAREAAAETVDAQRVEERLPSDTKPAAEVPTTTPAMAKNVEADFARFQPFVLRAATLVGSSVLRPASAGECARKHIGETVGPIELHGIAQCVTQLYRDRGYFLSRAIVPAQDVVYGNLTLQAIEGYIAAIAPDGLDQTDADAQFFDALSERPAKLATFERGLLMIADRYGHRVKASQLVADPNDPARFTYKLKVEVTPVSWRVFGDNRGTEAHGPEQAFAWVAWNSLFGAPDRLAVSLFTTPTDTRELLFGDINYARGWLNGTFWTEIGTSLSRTNDESGEGSDVDRIYGRVTVPIVRSRKQSLWAALAFDGRSTRETAPPVVTTREKTRTLRGSLSYTVSAGDTRADVLVEVARGLDVFDASQNGDAELTRVDARPQFTKLRFDAAFQQKLGERWQLALMAAGQLADGPLVAAEEFGAGGSRFGRAYDYSEVIGDDGIAGAMELRWNWSNVLGLLNNLQVYAFADAARIWNEGANPGVPLDADLSSAGGGLRITPVAGVNAIIEAGKPLSRVPSAQGDRDARVFVSLSLGW